MELQSALQEALKDSDYFDVYDALDEEDPEEERGGTASSSSAAASTAESGGLHCVSLSVCLSVYLSVCHCLSVCLSACLSACLPAYISPLCLSYIYVPLSVCLSLSLCNTPILHPLHYRRTQQQSIDLWVGM